MNAKQFLARKLLYRQTWSLSSHTLLQMGESNIAPHHTHAHTHIHRWTTNKSRINEPNTIRKLGGAAAQKCCSWWWWLWCWWSAENPHSGNRQTWNFLRNKMPKKCCCLSSCVASQPNKKLEYYLLLLAGRRCCRSCVYGGLFVFYCWFCAFFAPFIVGGILCFWLGCLRANKEILLQNQHNETPSASSSSWCSLTLLGSHTTPRQT